MAGAVPAPELTATRRVTEVPRWAALERELFARQDKAWRVFADRYTEGDGRLVFRDSLGRGLDDRDGVDDFYAPFFNWPTLYLLGGSADLLAASRRHWRGVTAQLTEMGLVVDGLERGYDWFHQGEGMLLFYGLCLADPGDAELRELACRFADVYLPGGPNYDAEHRVMKAPHNGARGPRFGFSDHDVYFPWSLALRPYGLPLDWGTGVTSFDELADSPVDILYLHDADNRSDEVRDTAYAAVRRLKDEGLVGAIGFGMNHSAPLAAFVAAYEVDVVLIAGRFSLLDHDAMGELLPLCERTGTAVVVGGVFNTGLLADPSSEAMFNYRPVPAEALARARECQVLCAEFGVPLPAAAVQFPYLHPAVTSVVVGCRTAAEVTGNAAAARLPIPDGLWERLAGKGFVPAELLAGRSDR